MHIFPIAVISLFHATALAAPTEGPFQSNPGDWGVYISTDWEWGNRETTGLFENFPVMGNDYCINLIATDWDKTISSFGPAKGVKCVVYDDYWCQGNSIPIWYSGYARLVNLNWDDRISSYECAYYNKDHEGEDGGDTVS